MDLKQHQIKKQLLDFEFKDKTRALEWQQKVPSQYQREYMKAIENVLNQFDDGRCQQIDKIIVDLGTVSEAKVADQLGKSLTNILKKTVLKTVQHYEVVNVDPTTKATVDLQVNTGKEELIYILRYFIAHGNFPWNVTVNSISELEVFLMDHFTTDELVVSLIAKKAFHSHWERARFFYQFESELVKKVFSKYFKKQYEELKIIIDFCKKQFGKASFAPHFSAVTYSTAIKSIPEWIALFAPDGKKLWSANFIPWFLERHWNSEIPFTFVSMWVSAHTVVRQSTTPHFIHQHLTKIFRHLDLHLSSILKEGGFRTSAAAAKAIKEQITPNISSAKNKRQLDENNEELQKRGEQEQSHEKNNSGVIRKPDDVGENPLEENKELDALKREKETPQNLNQVDEGKNEIRAEAFEENPRESITSQDQENKSKLEKEDQRSETFGKATDKIIQSGEIEKGNIQQNRVENKSQKDDDIVVDASKLNHETFEDDLIVSKEFYKEVQETIDVSAPEGTALWDAVEMDNFNTLEPYYIHDSGLLLVWPYLHRLFEKLDYIKTKKFVSKEMQERAVLLLGYIATGNPTCEEHQLVFAKFLCGWPFRMPIKKKVALEKKELKEANAMLKALIVNWNILKNTSVKGLRETFFYREGKLEAQEDDWKLTVEQKGTDILLDRLPYGISIIKLPWLKKLLRVDWA